MNRIVEAITVGVSSLYLMGSGAFLYQEYNKPGGLAGTQLASQTAAKDEQAGKRLALVQPVAERRMAKNAEQLPVAPQISAMQPAPFQYWPVPPQMRQLMPYPGWPVAYPGAGRQQQGHIVR